jgi:hypothetical protein
MVGRNGKLTIEDSKYIINPAHTEPKYPAISERQPRMKNSFKHPDDELKEEYDLQDDSHAEGLISAGLGRCHRIGADVAKAFPDDETVNEPCGC